MSTPSTSAYWSRQDTSRSVNEVNKKLDTLRNQHRRELRLMCNSKKSGAGSDETYTPKLWCFDILSFLNDGDYVRPAVSNMPSTATNQTTETVSEDVSDSEIYTDPLLLELQDSPRASTRPTSCSRTDNTCIREQSPVSPARTRPTKKVRVSDDTDKLI
ncbi:uncharacterized protein [Macrobrachium rosenbergii]|uniref:uncharacterized protein n=1 Tax=Macrobrachium rosenbergii TaxID=79674 RepID=UPI0034D49448